MRCSRPPTTDAELESPAGSPADPWNLADLLSRQARQAPDGVAVRSPHGGLTFQRLDLLVWRYAQRMAGFGLRAGDIVGLSFADELTAIVAMLATARLGATVCWIPRRAAPELRDALLSEVPARALLTDAPEGSAAGAAAPVRTIPLELSALAQARGPIDLRLRAARPTAPRMIITGSGSTGRPKRIPVSHRQFLGQMRAYRDALGLQPRDRVASTMTIDAVVTRERYLDAVLTGASVVRRRRCGPSSWVPRR